CVDNEGKKGTDMADKQAYSVNIDSPIAVFVQIENQIQFAISSRRVKPGDALPSVREMATMLDVNPNTVTKAYRDLEIMRLVHTRRGVGVTVAEKAMAISNGMTVAMTKSHLIDAVAECTAAGLSGGEIRKIVSQTIEDGITPYRIAKRR
ncbi:MAG: GntR family transcriptional regulator, partial [Candidatus Hydrogenedentes bacterium]|nr:GntR family transcriptional regulator [Candidatus Hydrogenedentota bacterium]